ncbi:MAG TPA: exodeoxyribonuclease VII large subunit, partial [Gaiellaceae bacterium]|nr:exodeoxyribonuclease VII large subunit [Gaiellaceae bacterium]
LLLERKRARLDTLAGRLRALSPQATLSRGYAVVRTREGEVVRSARSLAAGSGVDVQLAEGGFGARVEETRP